MAPRSSRLGVSVFARQLTVRPPGGVDIRLRFRPYQRTHRARRSSTNAQSARAGTSVTSIAATAGSSAGAWAWEASAQPATSRWPSVICYPNTPHPDHHGGQGAEPPLPRTPSPQVPSAPRIIKMEVIYRNLTLGFRAILVAAIGQVRWPPPGSLHDRHWAGPGSPAYPVKAEWALAARVRRRELSSDRVCERGEGAALPARIRLF